MKHLRTLFIAAACALLAVACQKPENQSDESTTLSAEVAFQAVGSDAVEAQFAITSNSGWSVKSNADWISDYTESGEGNGTITVHFPANTSSENERSASFAVTSGKKSIALTLTQARAGGEVSAAELSASPMSIEVPAEATEAVFDIKSNTIWGVYTEDDWFNEYTTMGEGNGKLTIKFDSYKNRKVNRTATFIVSAREATVTLTLTQIKTDKIEIADATAAQFSRFVKDEDMFYRVQGFITSIADAAAGKLTVKDATGTVEINGLLDKYQGESGKFASFGLVEGDYITVVGTKGDAALENGYFESGNHVTETDVAGYAALPADTDQWYKAKGVVEAIKDVNRGNLVLKTGSDKFEIVKVLSGALAADNSFSELGVREGDDLTVILAGKAAGKAPVAYYVAHESNTALDPQVLAKWKLDYAAMLETGGDLTWTGANIDGSSMDAHCYDNKAGDGGRYLKAYNGTADYVKGTADGTMTFVQGDKTALDPEGNIAERLMFYTGHAGAGGFIPDDYFLFTVDKKMPAGTKIKFTFTLRPNNAGCPKYWAVEILDGNTWVMMTDENGKASYSADGVTYNMAKTGTANVITAFTHKLDSSAPTLQLRIRTTGYTTCDGKTYDKICNKNIRFRPEASATKAPVIEVIE